MFLFDVRENSSDSGSFDFDKDLVVVSAGGLLKIKHESYLSLRHCP